MKLKFIYTLLGAAFFAFMFLSNAGGRAAGGNGNTGSPVDQVDNGSPLTCINCHNNNADVQIDLDIDVLDANNNSVASMGYTPGETYTVKVLVNATQGTPAGYGFQLSCLNAPLDVTGDEVATWTDIADNDNVKISTASNGRKYAEHDNPSQSNEFLVEWTAPNASSGAVTFYSCGNGVNLNDNRTGDGAACNTLELAEAGVNATTNFERDVVELEIYPNPVRETLSLDINNKVAGDYTLTIIDISGKIVKAEKLQLFTGEQTLSFDVSGLIKGHYSVQILNQEGGISKKMLKL